MISKIISSLYPKRAIGAICNYKTVALLAGAAAGVAAYRALPALPLQTEKAAVCAEEALRESLGKWQSYGKALEQGRINLLLLNLASFGVGLGAGAIYISNAVLNAAKLLIKTR